MADETAKLVVSVDSTSAVQAGKNIDQMTESARQAQREMRGFTAEQLAANRALNEGARSISNDQHALDLLADREKAAAVQAQRLAQASREAAAASATAAKGAKGHGDALGGLSLTSGAAAREYAVLINEMQRGDFTRFQGSLITLGNRIGLMPKLFTAMGAAVGGTLLVLGILATAMVKGALEQHEFNRAMEATGGYAGKTEDQIRGLTDAMQGAGHTYGETKDALLAVAESGQFAQDRIALVGRAVLDMSRVTGGSVEDMVKQFSKLQDDPVKGAMELDKSMHFLETSTLLAAQAAENMGDKEKAAEIIITAAAAAAHERAVNMEQDVGYMIARWRELKGAVSDAWNWMMNLGKKSTDLENVTSTTAAIRAAQAKLADVQRGTLNTKTGLFSPADTDEVHKYTVALNLAVAAGEHAQQKLLDNTQLAKSNAELAQQNHLANEAVVSINARTMATDRLARRTAELAKVHKDYENARKSADPKVRDDPTFSIEAEARAVKDIERAYRDYRPTRVAMTQTEKDARKATNEHNEEVKRLTKTIEDHRGVIDAQAGSETKLTAGQQWAAKTIAELHSAYSRLTPAEVAAFEADIKAAGAASDVNDARLREIKLTEEATQALDRYAKSGRARDIQNSREMAGVGHGQEYVQELTRQYQIIDAAENARIQLTEHARATETLETDAYKKGLADIGREMNAQLGREQKFYAERKDAMGDWRNGAQRAWEEFSTKANDVAGQTYDAFNTAFNGMEQAVQEFSNTGKVNIRSFATTVLAELAKIELRIILSKVLMSMFGASMNSASDPGISNPGGYTDNAGAGMSDGSFAAGGAFSAGRVVPMAAGGTLVNRPTIFPMARGYALGGEQGEEGLFPLTRNSRGQLALHGGGGGGIGQVQSNVTVVMQSDGTSKVENTDANSKQARMLGEFLTQRVKDILTAEQRQGGILWRMTNG